MKTKPLAIVFLVIVFAIAIANIPNIGKSIMSSAESGSIREKIDPIDSGYNEDFKPKYRFVEINGVACKTLRNEEINGTVVLNNGYLSYRFKKVDTKDRTKKIAELNDYLSDKGIEFVYIAVPYKNSPYDDQVPFGIYDHGNENQDSMLALLQEKGVRTFDLVPKLKEHSGNSWYGSYFKTDHHWKPETGFWAHTEVVRFLSEQYGLKTDAKAMELENYDIDTYRKWFLGSQGKKTGKYVAGVDDISLIYPKWDTNIKVTIPTKDIVRKGEFKQAVFDRKCLKKDYYRVNSFAAYLGNMLDLCNIENSTAANDKKILVVKDSFSIAMAPFLTFMFDEVDVFDLRYYKDETLREYIDRTRPDYVIMPYSASVFGTGSVFDFGL